MGNVELIELKTSRIQCPSCLHYVFKGTILCSCGKHIRPDLDMTRRFRAAFWNCQSNLLPCNDTKIQGVGQEHQQKTHCDVLKKVKDNKRRFGRDGKIMRLRESPNLPLTGQMRLWDIWITLRKLIPPRQRRIHEGKDTNIHFTYNEDRASATSTTKISVPRCKESIGLRCKNSHDKKLRIPFTSKRERQRLRYREWLSTNWAEYFAEERPQPSPSSSSWSPSSTWWSSSSQTPMLADVAATQLARRQVWTEHPLIQNVQMRTVCQHIHCTVWLHFTTRRRVPQELNGSGLHALVF